MGYHEKLKCLIFDSYFDPYRGVVALIRVMSGRITDTSKIKMFTTNTSYDVTELGYHTPASKKVESLGPGEVGYVCASIKNIEDVKVGDTIIKAKEILSSI